MKFRCPNCDHGIEIKQTVSDNIAGEELHIECPSCNSRFSLDENPTQTWTTHQVKIGNFQILEPLGEGAFGVVYKALDEKLERLVAIKIPKERRLGPSTVSEFIREAKSAAKIDDPGVVQVYEVGIHDSQPYIVSQLIDGLPLSKWLEIKKPNHEQTAILVRAIARSLQHAHERGIIHRDLKPSNVLMDNSGNPFITDFGLARNPNCDVTIGKTGQIIGTPAYMSPEQARGERKLVSSRSDVYSLGVVMYECLTNRLPFLPTDSRTLLYQVANDEVEPCRRITPQIPRELEAICMKALRKEPNQRYNSAGEMSADLDRYLRGHAIQARPPSVLYRFKKAVIRNPLPIAVASTLLLSLTTIFFLQHKQAEYTLPVAISVSLPKQAVLGSRKLSWAFAKLDDERKPIDQYIVRFDTATQQASLSLTPGDYLVAVSLNEKVFHEVYRHVPVSRSLIPGAYSNNSFEVDDSTIRLPSIELKPFESATEGMTLVKGGTFVAGRKGNPFSPPTSFEVEDFQIDQMEVTFGEFTKTMPTPSLYQNNESLTLDSQLSLPVVGVNWHQAAHFAELMGKRLLTEQEWEYAATNGGTTDFPWGNEVRTLTSQLEPVGSIEFDVTDLGIKGLLTNGAEITDSVLVPYGDGTMLSKAHQKAVGGFVYRGGPYKTPSEKKWQTTDRSALSDTNASGNFLSFRCGRSHYPSLLELTR